MYDLFSVIAIIILVVFLLGGLMGYSLKAMAAAQQADWGHRWLNYLDGLNRIFCKYYHRFEYTPIDLPPQGPAIVMANHLSGLDPFLLVAATCRPLRFLIAREQYERFGLKWFFRTIGCIPVDRSHHPEVALRIAWRALEKGEVIALFPQGTFVLPGQSQKLKRGGFWLAQQSQSPIYPAFISGISWPDSIFLSILWRSHATLIGYPVFEGSTKNNPESLRPLLEGKMIPPNPQFSSNGQGKIK